MRSKQATTEVGTDPASIPGQRSGGTAGAAAKVPLGRRRRLTAARNVDIRAVRGLALVLVLAYEVHPRWMATGATGAAVFALTCAFLAGNALAHRRNGSARSSGGGHAAPSAGPRMIGPVLAWTGAVTIGAAVGSPVPPALSGGLGLIGALGVVMGNAGRRDHLLGRTLGSRPAQYAGRLAYPAFLWLGLLIAAPDLFGHRPNHAVRIGLIAAATVLSALTKHLYESRYGDRVGQRRRSYLIATSSTLAVAGLILAPTATGTPSGGAADLVAAVTEATECAVPTGGVCAAAGPVSANSGRRATTPIPVGGEALAALPGGPGCWSAPPRFTAVQCVFGDRSANLSIALAGDAGAGEWLPALEVLALTKHWRITAFFASGCPLAAKAAAAVAGTVDAGCQSWVRRTTTTIGSGDYDLVLLANSSASAATSGLDATAAGHPSVLQELRRAGRTVIDISAAADRAAGR